MRLYLAANLFTPFDRKRNSQIAKRFSDEGYEVFLPQDLRTEDGQRPEPPAIFEGCVRGLDKCDVIVGLLDGSDVDSGTAWELGYAYALGKAVVALRTDYRGAEHGPVNIMLEFGSDALVVSADPMGSEISAVERLLAAVRNLRTRVNESDTGTERSNTVHGE